ncbi:DUF3667 domain-containing protein [Qipengyuania sp. YG27]|uniref:DUF3667 domain-containing protein n=1 Tax=Qipengyuania mesophila TaxID=2867246 RepID=A0ABS7JVN1_9SPHN|nr:DUF3667 domain-containing protein [Qipengyuania mesophila]MBX7501628.1 DUF3667 domain-containing protein [Qipengyuania mesophila]
MSDFGEALGTAVEGGLFAKAIGRGKSATPDGVPLERGHFAEGACLNCGTQLIGEHCHSCGQKAHLHRTLAAFGHDLLHGALHLDGKTWKTLPLLALRPGQLTRRYIEGERARFVSPMALFLFSIFLMFAVFQAVGLSAPTDIKTSDGLRADMEEVQQKAQEKVAAQEARVEVMAKDDEDYAKQVERLGSYREELDGITKARELVSGNNSAPGYTVSTIGVPFIDHALEKWRTNPGLMLYKLQSNSYKFSWLLIPLSVPFMWLLFFWKRRFRAYDHAIFVTYSIAFMSLLFIAISVAVKLGASEAVWASMLGLIPPIHIYKQLRGAYGLSRFSAFWRLCVLGVFISIVLSLFLQLLLILGAF